LLEIPSVDFRLKPFARPPAVDQNASRFFGTSEAAFWSTFKALRRAVRPHLNHNIKSGRHGATSILNPNNWSVAKPGVMWSGVLDYFL